MKYVPLFIACRSFYGMGPFRAPLLNTWSQILFTLTATFVTNTAQLIHLLVA